MQGYIETDLELFKNKKKLAEEKAKEIAIRNGFHLDKDGNIIGKDIHGNDQPGKQVTTSLFDILESALGGNYYAPSIRGVFPTTYLEIETYAGLVLVNIPEDYFPVITD